MSPKSLLAGLLIGSALTITITASAQGSSPFSDVFDGTFFTNSVHKLMRRGIIQGYDDGRFGPNDFVTRGQVSVLLDRYDQSVVAPLRQQISILRSELGLGSCGDHKVQAGEECDDGNLVDGDGCSSNCTSEIVCEGKYRVGESYPSPDGCNTCTCSRGGVSACTEMACIPNTKCTSSIDCTTGEYCTTEDGDCLSVCPPGSTVCPAVCAGYCMPRENKEPDSHREACEMQEEGIYNVLEATYFCEEDSDCILYSQSCPYITCAAAVSRDRLPIVKGLVQSYLDHCDDEPIPCAGCVPAETACVEGVCTLIEEYEVIY